MKTQTRVNHPTTKVVGQVKEEAPPPEEPAGRFYLLVFQDERSWMVSLPDEGSIVIGRADDVDLQLPGNAVSRRHAQLTIQDGAAQVVDLGSQNGVWVNGERISGPRGLSSGDSITISETSLIYHANSPPRPIVRRRTLDQELFRERVIEELERAHRFARELVLAIFIPSEGTDSNEFERELTAVIRLMDIASVEQVNAEHTATFYVLMPETGAADAPAAIARISRELADLDPQLRVGYACSPTDGNDLDALMTSARDAARVAVHGEARAARATSRAFELGDVEVVVAEPSMIRLYALIERLAASSLPVLITGETGTGKEIVARALHYWSQRSEQPYLTVNCAALHPNLAESELFGYAKGAFSGAVTDKAGLFEEAHGGTLFVDEISEAPPGVQSKLLRALQAGEIRRVGEPRARTVDVRVVAA
ncbi:MAG: sigma-54-dependent Fis family transcriptional regulator, partial [Myxococcales bacterium]|nr:sigma-54-dependent Fis family transcriptional regulator [Myxococcales bacterium]